MLLNPRDAPQTLARKRPFPRYSRPTDGSNRGQRMLQVTKTLSFLLFAPEFFRGTQKRAEPLLSEPECILGGTGRDSGEVNSRTDPSGQNLDWGSQESRMEASARRG